MEEVNLSGVVSQSEECIESDKEPRTSTPKRRRLRKSINVAGTVHSWQEPSSSQVSSESSSEDSCNGESQGVEADNAKDSTEDSTEDSSEDTSADSWDDDDDIAAHADDSENAENDANTEEGTLADDLAFWVARHEVKQNCVTDLLVILRRHDVNGLPKCARTLMKTRRDIQVQEMTGGQYYHFGIEASISYAVRSSEAKVREGVQVQLQINIDGLPISNSNNDHLWPILGMVEWDEYRSAPFCIGVFYSKNSKAGLAQEFLQQFVQEYKYLHQNGFKLLGVAVRIHLSAVICDAPAMAFIKEIKLHNGYGACFKCEERGVWQEGRMTFSNLLSRLRTDDRFRRKVDKDHHKPDVTSPFVDIEHLDMVEQFLYDYMHVVLLNVMKRLMRAWVYGPIPFKIDKKWVDCISSRLVLYAKTCPSEFGRKPRSLEHLRHFKATEYRSFLCYTGMITLLGIFKNSDVHYNFMLLCCAMRILLNPTLSQQYHGFAKKLITAFVNHYKQLYGEKMTVFSVHALIHLPRQAAQYGHLDRISSFPYESYLFKLKQLVRRPGCTLKQVVGRLYEHRQLSTPVYRTKSTATKCMMEHAAGHVPEEWKNRVAHQYEAVMYGGVKYSIKRRDSAVMVSGRKVAIIQNLLRDHDGGLFAVLQFFDVHENQFTDPLPSRIIGVHRCSRLRLKMSVRSLSDCKKVWLLPAKNGYFLAIELNNAIQY